MKKESLKIYIETLYSQESELNHIQDLNIRKEKAAIKAGFDPNDPVIRNLMNLKNSKANDEIIIYLNRNNSNAYAKLCADQQLFLRLQEKLMIETEGEDLDKLMKISERMDELIDRISEGYQRVYKHDEGVMHLAEKQIKMVSLEMRLKQKNSA